MLGKLLKYELSATSRQFLPLYGALVIFSILNRLFQLGEPFIMSLPVTISMTVFGALIVAMFVLTLVVMIQRFNKNLLSDEGYLMFTLPVKTSELVLSKLISSLIWLSASLAVLFVSLLIITPDTNAIHSIGDAWRELMMGFDAYTGNHTLLLVIEAAISVIGDLICSILIIYASISIGHLFGGRRIAASFGAFLLICIVHSGFEGGILGLLGILKRVLLLGPFIGGTSLNIPGTPLLLHGMFLIDFVFSALFSLICYATTIHVLSKRLNLE